MSFLLLLFSCGKDEPVKKSDEALITSFKIGSSKGTIKDNSIEVNVPFGTDITALKAVVEISAKATINPDPSKDNDYTNPATFTVTAEDGKTTKDYKVTVSLAKNDKAEILSWKVGGEVAVAKINGTDITITLAYEPDKKAIKSDVQLSPGASISPDPANSIDYTSAKTFTVTAEDGTTIKDYKVTVNLEDPIYSWTAGWRDDAAYTAAINQSTGKIEIDVNSADFDTKVNLSAGVNINPDPNNVTDWTNEVTFTAKKGSKTKTYKVKVKVNGKDIIKVNDANIKKTIEDEISKPNGDNANLNYIDVSSVTTMESLFEIPNNCKFKGDISKWNVSKVTNMKKTFKYHERCLLLSFRPNPFNQDIRDWDVSQVTNMEEMFDLANLFNQDISGWDVSKVTDMKGMFKGTEAFNQDISKWNVSNVTDMSQMFQKTKAFNQDIGGWDVSNVTDMSQMFSDTEAFNQDISKWNVSNVTNMNVMFRSAIKFNQDIGGWKVSNVTVMRSMFDNAKAFNQDISKWDVSNVTDMKRMFQRAKLFNQDIGGWKVSNVTDMNQMFYDAEAFNQDLSRWDVSKVNDCLLFSRGTVLITANKPKFNKCSP